MRRRWKHGCGERGCEVLLQTCKLPALRPASNGDPIPIPDSTAGCTCGGRQNTYTDKTCGHNRAPGAPTLETRACRDAPLLPQQPCQQPYPTVAHVRCAMLARRPGHARTHQLVSVVKVAAVEARLLLRCFALDLHGHAAARTGHLDSLRMLQSPMSCCKELATSSKWE